MNLMNLIIYCFWIPYFEKAVQILPDNKAAMLMLARCTEFAENKPENWDGAIALTSK